MQPSKYMHTFGAIPYFRTILYLLLWRSVNGMCEIFHMYIIVGYIQNIKTEFIYYYVVGILCYFSLSFFMFLLHLKQTSSVYKHTPSVFTNRTGGVRQERRK